MRVNGRAPKLSLAQRFSGPDLVDSSRDNAFEDLVLSPGPEDFEAIHHIRSPQPEVQVGQGAGGVGGGNGEFHLWPSR